MTTENLFTNKELFTKEQYLTIKSAWKKAVNDKRAKSYLTEEVHYDPRLRHVEPMVTRHRGWIQAEHHILYNLIRGKAPHRGFTLTKRPSCLENGAILNKGYHTGSRRLDRHIQTARQLIENEKTTFIKKKEHTVSPAREEQLNKFLEPFGGTITIKNLAQVNIHEYASIDSTFGPGKLIARAILEKGRDYIPNNVTGMTRTELDEYANQLREVLDANGT